MTHTQKQLCTCFLPSPSSFPRGHLYPGMGKHWKSLLEVSLAELSCRHKVHLTLDSGKPWSCRLCESCSSVCAHATVAAYRT